MTPARPACSNKDVTRCGEPQVGEREPDRQARHHQQLARGDAVAVRQGDGQDPDDAAGREEEGQRASLGPAVERRWPLHIARISLRARRREGPACLLAPRADRCEHVFGHDRLRPAGPIRAHRRCRRPRRAARRACRARTRAWARAARRRGVAGGRGIRDPCRDADGRGAGAVPAAGARAARPDGRGGGVGERPRAPGEPRGGGRVAATRARRASTRAACSGCTPAVSCACSATAISPRTAPSACAGRWPARGSGRGRRASARWSPPMARASGGRSGSPEPRISRRGRSRCCAVASRRPRSSSRSSGSGSRRSASSPRCRAARSPTASGALACSPTTSRAGATSRCARAARASFCASRSSCRSPARASSSGGRSCCSSTACWRAASGAGARCARSCSRRGSSRAARGASASSSARRSPIRSGCGWCSEGDWRCCPRRPRRCC